MAIFSIDALKSTIGKKGGLAPANRFNVMFTPPSQSLLNLDPEALVGSLVSGNGINPRNLVSDPRDISLLCESVQLPGRNISTFEHAHDKQTNKYPYTFIDDDITMTFHLTNDYYMRVLMDNWMSSIFDVENYMVGYKNDYSTDIIIQQLNQQDIPVYGVRLEKAYPINVAATELNNGNTEMVKVEVTFAYDKFVPEGPVSSTISTFKAAVPNVPSFSTVRNLLDL